MQLKMPKSNILFETSHLKSHSSTQEVLLDFATTTRNYIYLFGGVLQKTFSLFIIQALEIYCTMNDHRNILNESSKHKKWKPYKHLNIEY